MHESRGGYVTLLLQLSGLNMTQVSTEWQPVLSDAYSVAHKKLAQWLILVHQDELFILKEWSVVQLLADQDEKYKPSWWKEWITFILRHTLAQKGSILMAYSHFHYLSHVRTWKWKQQLYPQDMCKWKH